MSQELDPKRIQEIKKDLAERLKKGKIPNSPWWERSTQVRKDGCGAAGCRGSKHWIRDLKTGNYYYLCTYCDKGE